MDTIALHIQLKPVEPWNEIAIAELADYGFNSFEENENGIVAYGRADEVQLEDAYLNTFLNGENTEVTFTVTKELIPQKNWNAEWESHFEPVVIEDKLTILAPFHDKSLFHGLKIIIQPKMSFGTGHHQTTWMMAKLLMDLSVVPNHVLDMGTGTGILAFLAEKLGAKDILGVDIEPWSVDSCYENKEFNHSTETQFFCGDVDLIRGRTFHLILANINKNILKSQMNEYAKTLVSSGKLLLSGFFESDVEELVEAAKECDFTYEFHLSKETWAAIQLVKN